MAKHVSKAEHSLTVRINISVTQGGGMLNQYYVDSNDAFTAFINSEAPRFDPAEYVTFMEYARRAYVSVANEEVATNAFALLRKQSDDWAVRYTFELV